MDFAHEERKAIITLGVVAGFIIALDEVISIKNAVISIDYTEGLAFMLIAMLGMIFSVFIHEGAHKLMARLIGYFTHVSSYAWGLLAGGALSVFTFGWLQFFTPNTCDLEADPRARIAKHRKYENWKQEALIASTGIFATGLLAIIFHTAYVTTDAPIFQTLMQGNLWLMIYSLIPFELLTLYSLRLTQTIEQLPQSDGLYLLHYSIFAWIFAAVFALVLSALLYFLDTPGYAFALLIAGVTTFTVWLNMFKSS
jgi:hypothetical protein